MYVYTQYQKYAYFVFQHCEHNAILNSGHLKDLGKTQNTLRSPERAEKMIILKASLTESKRQKILKHLSIAHKPY